MDLAVKQIDAVGTEKLSLRALAREAGVSATAPYSHFPTKTCLLAAIATKGFRQLRQYMLDADDPEETTFERTVAMGMAYIRFAQEHPAAYRLMFGSVLDDFSSYEGLLKASDESYQHVIEMLGKIRKEYQLDVDLEMLGAVVWANVHGTASLLIDKSESDSSMTTPRRSLIRLHEQTEAALRLSMQGFMR